VNDLTSQTTGMPNQRATSTSYKKGVSGNPKGAPAKELRLSHVIEKKMREIRNYEGYDEAVERVNFLAEKMITIAENTNDPAVLLSYIKEIADRTEGKPKQTSDVTSNGESITGIAVTFMGESDNGTEL
jgi:hypothetical protein